MGNFMKYVFTEKEFAAVLADIYVKRRNEFEERAGQLLNRAKSKVFSEDVKVARNLTEKAYETWMVYHAGIDLLPPKLKQVFDEEYKLRTA